MEKSKKSNTNGELNKNEHTLPGHAHKIAAIGSKAESIINLVYLSKAEDMFFKVIDEELKKLSEAFSNEWEDEEASKVLNKYIEFVRSGEIYDLFSLSRWLLSHKNEASKVIDCMSLKPPDEISINKVLSTAGSTKLVFQATWSLTQAPVVLKQLIGPEEEIKKILLHEMQAHALSMSHPNIIETHKLVNSAGEVFLVEEFLPVVLDDKWPAKGIYEAANLLNHISRALVYLHNLDRIHGDIKPDNIGKKDDLYILLDFGICRKSADFKPETTATGSLRTRAPELLLSDSYEYPFKADIWALSATVYNTLVGRFPLFDKNEPVPRITKPEEREKFEKLLKNRVENEWESRIDLKLIPEQLIEILSKGLDKNPELRPDAKELIELSKNQLSGFLREPEEKSPGFSVYSPIETLGQLSKYLPNKKDNIELIPKTTKETLLKLVKKIRSFNSISEENIENADKLINLLEE